MVNVVTPTDTVAYMPESARAVHKQASTKGKLRGRLWPRFTLRNSLLTSHKFLEFLVVAGTLRKFNFCAETYKHSFQPSELDNFSLFLSLWFSFDIFFALKQKCIRRMYCRSEKWNRFKSCIAKFQETTNPLYYNIKLFTIKHSDSYMFRIFCGSSSGTVHQYLYKM